MILVGIYLLFFLNYTLLLLEKKNYLPPILDRLIRFTAGLALVLLIVFICVAFLLMFASLGGRLYLMAIYTDISEYKLLFPLLLALIGVFVINVFFFIKVKKNKES